MTDPTQETTTSADLLMADTSGDATTEGGIFGIPLNRIVAFVGPYISVAAGAVATWLLTHVHILSTFNFSHNQVAMAISQLVVFGVTSGVVWLGHQKWLDGWQKYEADARLLALKVLPLVEHPAGNAFDPVAAKAEADRRAASVGGTTATTVPVTKTP